MCRYEAKFHPLKQTAIQKMDHPGFLLENLILSQNKAVGFRHTKVQLSCAICAFFFPVCQDENDEETLFDVT